MQGHNDSFNFFIFNAKLKDYGEANWVGDIFVKKQRHKSRQLLMRSQRDTSKELVSYFSTLPYFFHPDLVQWYPLV